MKNIHLIANAHLDPVWLWRWQEGCSEALSTFLTVYEMTEEFHGFIFNHNESLLYEWVKENNPALYKNIQTAVREGKWSIMGGWYLQPDCNMPSGESLIRNIEKGRRFFKKEFGKMPATAINFDSFGHSRGLVQILKKTGYDSYLVCRPAENNYEFPNQDFIWEGLDSSTVIVHRSDENYNSVWGEAKKELLEFLPKKESEEVFLFLWGVGDHGGGPSRKDLRDLGELIPDKGKYHIMHSTPEAYFQELKGQKLSLPVVKRGLNPVAQGCYTSQIRVKQKHRLLENEIYSLEKMAVHAEVLTGRKYPAKRLEKAIQALLFSEFHDALPGSGSPLVEEDTLRILDYGQEIAAREKHYAALALAQGEGRTVEGTSVILFYNPHPYDIAGVFTCETGLPKQNWTTDFMYPEVIFNGKSVPTQAEKENSNFSIDWRKNVVVYATLKAASLSRMDVYYKPLPCRPVFKEIISEPEYVFDNGEMKVVINTVTGLVKEYSIYGEVFLTEDSFQLVSFEDTYNPWGIKPQKEARRREFKLLPAEEGSEFCGLKSTLIPSVRIIEDGQVRTTIEAVFGINGSKAFIRYKLPKQGKCFEIETGVHFAEKEEYLKLMLKMPCGFDKLHGQIIFGREELEKEEETVSQKWIMAENTAAGNSIAVINNGTYGGSLIPNELGITLLRSAGYTASDFIMGKALQEEQWAPRMEQGERFYRFQIAGGKSSELNCTIDRMAQSYNEEPYAFSYCPPGLGEKTKSFMEMDNPRVIVSALKKAEDSEDYILRLYEGTGEEAVVNISFLNGEFSQRITLKGFEIKTYRLCTAQKTLEETTMIED